MKLTDFSEAQLRTERFVHAHMPANAVYYRFNLSFGWELYAPNTCCTNRTMSPAMITDTTWAIYKPELKPEKGKFYKDRAGSIFECLTTEATGICPCACLDTTTKQIYRFSLKGKYYIHLTEEHPADLIEEVPAP